MIAGIWCASMILDLKVTFAHKSYITRHEYSLVLSFAYGRFRPPAATLLTGGIESACVLFLPVLFFFEINLGSRAAIAYFFALLHATATNSNETFVRRNISK